MMPTFANPAAFWLLLGVPAIVVIHCLQQRSRTVPTSTLFLLEALAPESQGGRAWDRLRASPPFWLQLAALVLATWVLAAPRWLRAESAQRVVAVLDSAIAMTAFREEALTALDQKFSASDGRAARTDWIVMSSDPREPPLYRGEDRVAAKRAAEAWQPALGTHDYGPALRLAHGIAGATGLVWFITDSRGKVPPGQLAAGVGRRLDNVGFAGGRVLRAEDGGMAWRALVRNTTDQASRRAWWLESAGTRTAEQVIDLPPGALTELSGRFPDNAAEGTLVLSLDAFATDDRLPLVRPASRRLTASVAVDGDAGEFFKKLLLGIEGVSLVTTAEGAQLEISRPATLPASQTKAAVFLAQAAEGERRLLRAPIVAERHPLTDELNWQGLLGSGPASRVLEPTGQALLWQDDKALVWLRGTNEETRALVLNLDWEAGNASRLPAFVLLVRRFVEAVRDAQPGTWADNFDVGAPITLTARDRAAAENVTFETKPLGGAASLRTVPVGERAVLRAPRQPGFFEVRLGDRPLVRGAAQFADARQADFRSAETFATDAEPGGASTAALERNTRADPFAAVWLVLIGAALLGSWWPWRSAP